jgi:peptide-methionine (S)-S-oxide reductase
MEGRIGMIENMKETAVFGSGCFWCTEAVFKMLRGIASLEPGYAGGSTENPTYEEVSTGTTGHAEVVRVTFDPTQVSYHDLLTVFFATHDGTQVNRQGNDIGPQYRSLILYTTDDQKRESELFINELNASSTDGDPIATEVKPLTVFYPAEPEHLDFYANNRNAPYCQIIIAPKLQKVQQEFAELLNKQV